MINLSKITKPEEDFYLYGKKYKKIEYEDKVTLESYNEKTGLKVVSYFPKTGYDNENEIYKLMRANLLKLLNG